MKREIKQTEWESLIEQINGVFDDIAEIYVAHVPSAEKVSRLHVTVHTGDAESLEQYIEITSADEVVIDIGGAEPLCLPYDVMATFDGPGHINGAKGTTVYKSDDVVGADSQQLDTGLTILRRKLAGAADSAETDSS